MSGHPRASFGAVYAAVPGPLAAVLVDLVPWETVALKLAHAPASTRSAAAAGWGQLRNTAALYGHYVRQDLTPPALPSEASAAWLTTKECADIANVETRTVRYWIEKGLVECRKIDGAFRVEPGRRAEHLARRAEGRDFPAAEAGNLSAA